MRQRGVETEHTAPDDGCELTGEKYGICISAQNTAGVGVVQPEEEPMPLGTLKVLQVWEHKRLCVLALVTQSCPTLCDPMDCNLPGSSVHGDSPSKNHGVGFHALLQGIFPTQGSNPGLPHCRRILYHLRHQESSRILEWVAYHFSRGSSRPGNPTGFFCIAGRFFTSWATREALKTVLQARYFLPEL